MPTDSAGELQQVAHHRDEVLLVHHPLLQVLLEAELDVELEAADLGKVVLALVEEQAVEQRRGGVLGGRVARTQSPVHLHDRVELGADRVLLDGLGEDLAHQVPAREGELQLLLTELLGPGEELRRDLRVGLGDHLAGRRVDEVLGEDRIDERVVGDRDVASPLLLQRLAQLRVETQAGEELGAVVRRPTWAVARSSSIARSRSSRCSVTFSSPTLPSVLSASNSGLMSCIPSLLLLMV